MDAKAKLKEKAIKLLIKLFILSLVISICKSVMMLEANVPGAPECISMPTIGSTNYSNIAKGSVAVYANGLYDMTMTTDKNGNKIEQTPPTFNTSSGSYGQWVNSGLFIDGSGTQTITINVAGSVFMNNYNGDICVSNTAFNSLPSSATSPQTFTPTIGGGNIIISKGTTITAYLLNDITTNNICGGSTGSNITWGNASGSSNTLSSSNLGSFNPFSRGSWTDGNIAKNTYTSNGVGMGVVLCPNSNPNCSFSDPYFQSDYSSRQSNSNFIFFKNDTPVDPTYKTFGFNITGTDTANGILAFNIHNCENCYRCDYNNCDAQYCDNTTTIFGTTRTCTGIRSIACNSAKYVLSSGQSCPNSDCNNDTTGTVNCGSTSGVYIGNCVTGSASFRSKTPITYYSQNQGTYAFHLSAQDCLSYGYAPSTCEAYKGATKAGILQMAITSGDPNENTNNISTTVDISNANSTYYSSVNSTSYTYVQTDITPTGQIWYRINDDAYGSPLTNNTDTVGSTAGTGSYANNYGQLIVDTEVGTLSTSVVSDYVLPSLRNIKEQLLGARSIIYDNIAVGAGTYKTIILAMVNLYIAIYGVLFVSGLVQGNYTDIVIRLAKIGFIFNFLGSDGGWQYFSDTFLALFEQGGAYLEELILNAPSDTIASTVTNKLTGATTTTYTTSTDFESYLFSFFSDTIGYVLNPNLWLIITTLVGSIGFVLALCLIYCMFILLKVVFQMIISYIFALISFSLVVSVSPIFIAFSLFDRTKNYFRMWYQQLFYFSLQPILMFMTTLFFFSIINSFLNNIMSFKVCKTIYTLTLSGLPPFFSFMDYKPVNLSIFTLIPAILSLLCLTKLLERAADFGGQIASSLTSPEGPSTSFTGKGSVANSISHFIGSSATQLLGIDKASRARRDYAAKQNKVSRSDPSHNHERPEDNNKTPDHIQHGEETINPMHSENQSTRNSNNPTNHHELANFADFNSKEAIEAFSKHNPPTEHKAESKDDPFLDHNLKEHTQHGEETINPTLSKNQLYKNRVAEALRKSKEASKGPKIDTSSTPNKATLDHSSEKKYNDAFDPNISRSSFEGAVPSTSKMTFDEFDTTHSETKHTDAIPSDAFKGFDQNNKTPTDKTKQDKDGDK